jgi:GT2 family glycosyltransferase
MSIDLPLSDAPRVSVIIPSSTRIDLLRACLRSLARFGPTSIPYETIVVATSEVESQLRGSVTGIQLVSSRVNLGMAGAGNRGRALARGELLILLHDDAEIEAGWMEALVETADAHPEAGAIGGKALFPDGRLQSEGAILWRTGQVSLTWVGEALSFNRLRAVDVCGTSSLLVRAALWDLVGGLDEQFYPVYYVEVDLGMAIREHGFIVLYQPNSCIRHHQGASTNNYDFKLFVFHRNRLLLVKKWGAALNNQEPFESDSPAAVERALARAEIFAEQCRRRGNVIAKNLGSPKSFDAAEQYYRHVEKSRELQQAYAAYRTRRRRRAFARQVACSLMGTKLYERARRMLGHIIPQNFP